MRTIGDQGKLGLREMRKRPGRIVKQRQFWIMVAVSVDEPSQLLGGVEGQPAGKRDAEEFAQMALIKQAAHVLCQPAHTKPSFGPSPGGSKARQRKLTLRVERVVQVEHQDEFAHAVSLASGRGRSTVLRCHSANPNRPTAPA